jgi:hypothetical protein
MSFVSRPDRRSAPGMRDGLSSWCRRCHAGAVRRSKEKARARALLEEARFHVEVADEFGDHEWRHKRAASLREESEENPRRKLYAKSDRLVGGFGELRSARRGVSIVETCPGGREAGQPPQRCPLLVSPGCSLRLPCQATPPLGGRNLYRHGEAFAWVFVGYLARRSLRCEWKCSRSTERLNKTRGAAAAPPPSSEKGSGENQPLRKETPRRGMVARVLESR